MCQDDYTGVSEEISGFTYAVSLTARRFVRKW